MSDFWANLSANLIGTFTGAGLALLSSWWLGRRATRRREVRSVQGAIDRLARSRAFTHSLIEQKKRLSPDELEDMKRSTASVLATRERLTRVIENLLIDNEAIPFLEEMHGACAVYLRTVETEPSDYVRALVDLRSILTLLVQRLCQVDRRLRFAGPGELAFPQTELGDPRNGSDSLT